MPFTNRCLSQVLHASGSGAALGLITDPNTPESKTTYEVAFTFLPSHPCEPCSLVHGIAGGLKAYPHPASCEVAGKSRVVPPLLTM